MKNAERRAKNIQVMEKSGTDPGIGKWPGDLGFTGGFFVSGQPTRVGRERSVGATYGSDLGLTRG